MDGLWPRKGSNMVEADSRNGNHVISEEVLQSKAWAIHQWMLRSPENEWVQRIGKMWLAKLWRE